MRLISYVGKRYEDGGWSGVCRFDYDLRRVFPDILSVTELPADLDPSSDIVITDNHLSIFVPENVRTVVVHHGCAQTHYERDIHWRNEKTERMVEDQRGMFIYPNRWYVAPSEWVAQEFRRVAGSTPVTHTIIPYYVEPFGPAVRHARKKPVVIGDWRDPNKGSLLVDALRAKMRDIEFRQLDFPPNEEARRAFYLEADLYLCLSLSDGAPYAVADAEACELPIVSTDVGWAGMFRSIRTFSWKKRDDLDVAAFHIRKALREERGPSYYRSYTFEKHAEAWRNLIGKVERGDDVRAVTEEYGREIRRVAVSLAGGIGNAIFNLPLLAALKQMGLEVVGCVDTDTPTLPLWKRCIYLDEAVECDMDPPPADAYLSGPWTARGFRSTHVGRWRNSQLYHTPEWSMLLELASSLGWCGSKPDVSGWCRPFLRYPRYDVAIIPGCKPAEIWERKKYPRMADVARSLIDHGRSVAIVGTEVDRGTTPIPGDDWIGKLAIEDLPDFLAGCRVIVGTDSGAAQLGASLGVPTVMIFTATSPVKGDPVGSRVRKIYRSLPCSPCQSTKVWQKCSDWICRDVPPNDIVRAAMAFLDEG